jgi:hypothetical protein
MLHMAFALGGGTGTQRGVGYFSQSETQAACRTPWVPRWGNKGSCGSLEAFREGCPEEAVPKLRPEAGEGGNWSLGRKKGQL